MPSEWWSDFAAHAAAKLRCGKLPEGCCRNSELRQPAAPVAIQGAVRIWLLDEKAGNHLLLFLGEGPDAFFERCCVQIVECQGRHQSGWDSVDLTRVKQRGEQEGGQVVLEGFQV